MSPTIETPLDVTNRVRNQLLDNPYRALRRVEWDYRDGVLTLTGRLPSYYLKQLAQVAVAGVAGVEQVVNQIEVVPALREPAHV
jgi:osmotically-inducible protein OsmY